MAEATLSAKHRITLPKEARDALGLKAGDKVSIVVRGTRVIVLENMQPGHVAIRGLAKKAYPDDYLEKERASWD